jgi:putative membrane protein
MNDSNQSATAPGAGQRKPDYVTVESTTRLAVERTRLAYDRTLMAWVRTAISLISFGFTVYKFFQIEQGDAASGRLVGPREFALAMISVGLVALLLATVEHRTNVRALKTLYADIPRSKVAQVVAAIVGLLGIVALLAVLLRE